MLSQWLHATTHDPMRAVLSRNLDLPASKKTAGLAMLAVKQVLHSEEARP
jgi:hypothetical protein